MSGAWRPGEEGDDLMGRAMTCRAQQPVENVTMIDLKPFCSTDEMRPYLHQPWSVGDYTYATNGHIIVRVPRRSDVPENPQAPNNAPRLFATFPQAGFRALHVVPLPAPKEKKCLHCNGRGHEHDCPDCECVCENCNGTGNVNVDAKIAVNIGTFPAALRYARILIGLPNIEVAVDVSHPMDPLPFKFDGGDGLLMGVHGADAFIEIVL